jgi:hypothetical protein
MATVRYAPMVASLIIATLFGALFGFAAGSGAAWLIITISVLIAISIIGFVAYYCWWLPRKRRRAANGDGSTKLSAAAAQELPLVSLVALRGGVGTGTGADATDDSA